MHLVRKCTGCSEHFFRTQPAVLLNNVPPVEESSCLHQRHLSQVARTISLRIPQGNADIYSLQMARMGLLLPLGTLQVMHLSRFAPIALSRPLNTDMANSGRF